MAQGVSFLVFTLGVLCAHCIGASLPGFEIFFFDVIKIFPMHIIFIVYFMICRFSLFMESVFLCLCFIH